MAGTISNTGTTLRVIVPKTDFSGRQCNSFSARIVRCNARLTEAGQASVDRESGVAKACIHGDTVAKVRHPIHPVPSFEEGLDC